MARRRLVSVLAIATLLIGAAAGTAGVRAAAPAAGPVAVTLAPDENALLRLSVPDAATLESLVEKGYDLAGPVRAVGSGYQVDAVVSGAELKTLRGQGIAPTQVIERAGDGKARYQASVKAQVARVAEGLSPHLRTNATTGAVEAVNTDTLHFLQAYWWTTSGQTFIGAQVTTTATEDPDVQITVTWRTRDGRTGSFPLERFVDDGEY